MDRAFESRRAAMPILRAVLNGTVLPPPACHHSRMSNNKNKRQTYQAVLASVKREMAEPRISESARTESEKERTAAVKEAAET